MSDGNQFDGDGAAADVIQDIATLVDADRDTHGDAVAQQEAAAEAWSWYLSTHKKLAPGSEITGADVARLMALLKMSRAGIGSYDIDHDRDIIGYGGIAAACEVFEGNADEQDLIRGDNNE
jgi:hypothetical protein